MTSPARVFPHRHVLGIAPMSADDLVQVLDLAETLLEISERPIKKVPTLRGRTVINLFLEPSTRTRTSFEIAAKRLSADAVNISGQASSTVKGETLLDAATIRRHKGRIAGLEVAIVGDIDHSRVARSNLYALTRLGARVRLCAPRTMMPAGIDAMLGDEAGRVRLCYRLDEALEGADVVMMLRIQKERLGAVGLFPNTREYSRYFGLSPSNVDRAKPDAIVMHPGPINRGVELDPAVADGPRSVILDQVTWGVAVRMALLYLLGAGGEARLEG